MIFSAYFDPEQYIVPPSALVSFWTKFADSDLDWIRIYLGWWIRVHESKAGG